MVFNTDSKVVFIGDSITDCDRKRPIGEGSSNGLGSGYVSIIAGLVQSIYAEKRIRIINMGVSGNTSRDLKERFDKDALQLNPDWISIMIGINDVWRQFDRPFMKENHVCIDEYEENVEYIINHAKSKGTNLILMTPFFIEPNKDEPMRKLMDRYGTIVNKLAEKHNTLFVNTQAAFDVLLNHVHSSAIASDRVHPDFTGHTVIAKAFLEKVSFDWVM